MANNAGEFIDMAIDKYKEAKKHILIGNNNYRADNIIKLIDEEIGHLAYARGKINSLDNQVYNAIQEYDDKMKKKNKSTKNNNNGNQEQIS